MTEAQRFMEWMSENYDKQKRKLSAYTVQNSFEWDEDVFSETIIKVYDKIEKSGLKDPSVSGTDAYFFISYKTNLLREGQYVRNAKRDKNVDDVDGAYDDYANLNMLSCREKLLQDLWKDYSVIYLLGVVEHHFDAETYYLVRLKFLENLTYRKLSERTHIKSARQKVVNCIKFLRENVTKEEIRRAMMEDYGDGIDFNGELNF